MLKTSPINQPGSQPVSVRSANPAKIILIPGGKQVRVTLTGSGLDQTSSALILKERNPVHTVSADLGPASRGVRIVTLSADPTAQPGSYTLRIIVDGGNVDIHSGVLAIMIKNGLPKAISSKSPSGPASRYPEVGRVPGDNLSPIPVQPTTTSDRAVKIVPLKSQSVKPSTVPPSGGTKNDSEPLERRQPTLRQPRESVTISGSVNPEGSGPIDLTQPQTPPEEDDGGSDNEPSNGVPMVRAEAASQNLALAQPGSQDEEEQDCGTKTMPELRQLLSETEASQFNARGTYDNYSSHVDSLLRQFSTKSAMNPVPAVSDAHITTMAEDIASGADASALMAELENYLGDLSQDDIMSLLIALLKTAIQSFQDDQEYFLNMLEIMNEISESMGDHLEELIDLMAQLEDERTSEICPEIRLTELALAEAETKFNAQNRQLTAEISGKNAILNRLPTLKKELEEAIRAEYTKRKKGGFTTVR